MTLLHYYIGVNACFIARHRCRNPPEVCNSAQGHIWISEVSLTETYSDSEIFSDSTSATRALAGLETLLLSFLATVWTTNSERGVPVDPRDVADCGRLDADPGRELAVYELNHRSRRLTTRKSHRSGVDDSAEPNQAQRKSALGSIQKW
jgi:hypothetical protein